MGPGLPCPWGKMGDHRGVEPACVSSLLAVGWDSEATSLHAKSLCLTSSFFYPGSMATLGWQTINCFKRHCHSSGRGVHRTAVVTGTRNALTCLYFLPGLMEPVSSATGALWEQFCLFVSLLELLERSPI